MKFKSINMESSQTSSSYYPIVINCTIWNILDQNWGVWDYFKIFGIYNLLQIM